jgi:hypothetical protein
LSTSSSFTFHQQKAVVCQRELNGGVKNKEEEDASFENKVRILKEQVRVFKYDYSLKKRLHAELIQKFEGIDVDQRVTVPTTTSSIYIEETLDDNTDEMLLSSDDLTLMNNNNNNNRNDNIDDEFETNLKIVNQMKQSESAGSSSSEDLPLIETINMSNLIKSGEKGGFKQQRRRGVVIVAARGKQQLIENEYSDDLKSLSSIEGSLQGILIDDLSSKTKCRNVNDGGEDDGEEQVCSSTPLIHLYPKIGKRALYLYMIFYFIVIVLLTEIFMQYFERMFIVC